MSEVYPGCVVELPDGRKGTIRFVGNTDFRPGVWAGIELEGPTGKNDGSIEGERYFECEENYGMFVNASNLSDRVTERPPKPTAKGKTAGNAAPTSRARAQTGVTPGSNGLKKPGTSAAVAANAKRHSMSASPSSAPKPALQRTGLRVCQLLQTQCISFC